MEQYNPSGEKFDPNLHQAMFEVPDPTKEAGMVAIVTKVGRQGGHGGGRSGHVWPLQRTGRARDAGALVGAVAPTLPHWTSLYMPPTPPNSEATKCTTASCGPPRSACTRRREGSGSRVGCGGSPVFRQRQLQARLKNGRALPILLSGM